MNDVWADLDREWDRWREEGRVADLWLRDDDAVEPSAALDRLTDLTNRFEVPVLLAVIPAFASTALAAQVRRQPLTGICQHGYAHINHAPPGAKAAELGADRPLKTVLEELALGRRRLDDLFGGAVEPALVPPWNRIAPALLAHLPRLGFQTLSTFGMAHAQTTPDLLVRNCHVDVIDWKATRRGHRAEKLVADLVEVLAVSRAAGGAPVGILTHHLVHGEAAWSFLHGLLQRTQNHSACRWVPFAALRRPRA